MARDEENMSKRGEVEDAGKKKKTKTKKRKRKGKKEEPEESAAKQEAVPDIRSQHAEQMEWRKKREKVCDPESPDLALHRAILADDKLRIAAIVQECVTDASLAHRLDVRDHLGNTPLALAIHLRQVPTVELLLEKGAETTWKCGAGWSVMQDAMASGDEDIVVLLMQRMKGVVESRFEERIPIAVEALQDLPDFYMELEWEFGTWVPLLSRLCPYDKYKIWKKGSWVRVDTTLIGFENLQWVRGDVSLLFKGSDASLEGREGYGGSHLIIMDHKRQRVEFAMDSLKKYSIGNKKKDANVEDILSGDIMRIKLDVDGVTFSPAKTWMGYEKKELIKNLWNAKVFDISGLQRVTMKRVDTRPIPRRTRRPPVENPSIDADLYFQASPDPDFPKGTGLLYPHEQLKVSKKKHTAKMWLSEDFPVSVQELLPLFAILAPSGKHFDKLESFLNMHMPGKGFPVKIEIPVFPTVAGTVTFGEFDMDCDIPQELFEIPEEYTVLTGNKSMIFTKRSQKQREKDRKQLEKVERIVKSVKGLGRKSSSSVVSASNPAIAGADSDAEEELKRLQLSLSDEEELGEEEFYSGDEDFEESDEAA